MPDKINPEIPIKLDKLRHLRYSVNAMITFEGLTGLNLLNPSVQKKLATDLSLTYLRAFLYSCLVHEDETLTLNKVGEFMTSENMAEILDAIKRAQQAAMPEVKEALEKSPLVTRKSRVG